MATATPAASGVEIAADVELPELDEGDHCEEPLPLDVAVRKFGEPMTPELLTELHEANELVPTP